MRRLPIALALAAVAVPGPVAAKSATTTSAVDIGTLHLLADCMVDRYRPAIRRLLALDYRSRAYDHALHTLYDESSRCLPFAWGELRSSRMLVAGAFAERLLPAARGGSGLAERVAHDPSRPAMAARDEGEYLALCAVRTMPDKVDQLLATKPMGEEERLAFAGIRPLLGPCLRSGTAARLNRPGLRAVLALAAYRIVSQAGPRAARQDEAGETGK